MKPTSLRQKDQIRSSDIYNDTIADVNPSVHIPLHLEDDLNAIRTQLKNILGEGNWWSTPKINLLSFSQKTNFKWYTIEGNLGSVEPDAPADDLYIVGDGESVQTSISEKTITISNILPYFKFYEDSGENVTSAGTDNDTLTFVSGSDMIVNISSDTIEFEYDGDLLFAFNSWFTIQSDNGSLEASRRLDELTIIGEGGINTDVSGRRVNIAAPQNLSSTGTLDVESLKLMGINPGSIVHVNENKELVGDTSQLAWNSNNNSLQIGSEKTEALSLGKNKLRINVDSSIFKEVSSKSINNGYIFIYGNKLIVFSNDVYIYDFSDPEAIQFRLLGTISSVGLTSNLKNIHGYGNYLIGSDNGNLFYVDLEKYTFNQIQFIEPNIGAVSDFDIIGSSVFYVVGSDIGEIDISNLNNPCFIRNKDIGYDNISSITISGNYAFISVEDNGDYRLETIDLRNDFSILSSSNTYGSEISILDHDDNNVIFSVSNDFYIFDISDKNNIIELATGSGSYSIDNAYLLSPYVFVVDSIDNSIRVYLLDYTVPFLTEISSFDLGSISGPENIAFSGGYLVYSNSSNAYIYKIKGLESPNVVSDSLRAEQIDVLGSVSAAEPSFVHQGLRVGFHGLHIDEGSGLRTDSDIKIAGNTAIGGHRSADHVVDIRGKSVIQKRSVLNQIAKFNITDGNARGICVEDNIAYVSGRYLTIVDFSDISNIALRDEYLFPNAGNSGRIIKIGDYIYTEPNGDQVYILPVENPDSIGSLTQYPKNNYMPALGTQTSGSSSIVINGNFPFQAGTSGILEIYNGSGYDVYSYINYQRNTPSSQISTFTISGTLSQNYATNSMVRLPNLSNIFNAAYGIYEGWSKYGQYLIASSRNVNSALPGRELGVWDVTNPTVPEVLYESSNLGNSICSNYVYNGIVYVRNGSRLRLYDISNPQNIQYLGQSGTFSGTYASFAIRGNYFYGFSFSGPFSIYDISNINSPTLVGTVNNSGINGAYRMYLCGNLAVCACWNFPSGKIVVVDVSDPSSPSIVQTIGTNPIDNDISKRNSGIALDDTIDGVAQTLRVYQQTISKITVSIAATGSPTGMVVAKIYNTANTFGTNSIPTGTVLATSNPIDVSTLSDSYTNVDFIFRPSEKIQLGGSFKAISIEYSDGSSDDYISIGTDTTSSYEGYFSYLRGSWNSENSQDMVFEIEYDGLVDHGRSFDMAIEGNRLYVINEDSKEIVVYDINVSEFSSIKSGKTNVGISKIDGRLFVEGITSAKNIFVSDGLIVGEGVGTVVEKNALFLRELSIGKGRQESDDYAALDVRGRSFVVENHNILITEENFNHGKSFDLAKFHNGFLWGLDLTDNSYGVFSINNNIDIKDTSTYAKLINIGTIGDSLKTNIDFDFTGEYLIGVYYQNSLGYMRSVDITNPESPDILSEISLLGIPSSLDIYGRYAYVCYSGNSVIDIYDISDPSNIVLAQRNLIPQITYPKRVLKKGNIVFVFNEGPTSYVSILRQDGSTLNYINYFSSSLYSFANKKQMEIVDDFIYFINSPSFNDSRITVVKISKVYGSNVILTGSLVDLQKYNQISISENVKGFNILGDFIYVTTDKSIFVYDISDRLFPVFIKKIDIPFESDSNQVLLGNRFYNFSEEDIVISELRSIKSPGMSISELSVNKSYIWSSVDVGRRFDPNSMAIGPGGLIIDEGNGLSTDSDMYVKSNSSIGLRLPGISNSDTGNLLNLYGDGLVQIPQKSSIKESFLSLSYYSPNEYSISDAYFFENTLFVGLYDKIEERLESVIEFYPINSEKEKSSASSIASRYIFNSFLEFNFQIQNKKIFVSTDPYEGLLKVYSINDQNNTLEQTDIIPVISSFAGEILGFKVYGNTLIVFQQTNKEGNGFRLQIIDISNYSSPNLLFEREISENIFLDFKIYGNIIYYSSDNDDSSFEIINASSTSYSEILRSFSIAGNERPTYFAVNNNIIYFSGKDNNLYYSKITDIIDDDFSPIITDQAFVDPVQFETYGDYLFVLCKKYLNIYDISKEEPSLIEQIGVNDTFGLSYDYSFIRMNNDDVYLFSNSSNHIWRVSFSKTKSPLFNATCSIIGDIFSKNMISMGDLFSQGMTVGDGGIQVGRNISFNKDVFVSDKFIVGQVDSSNSEYDFIISNTNVVHKPKYNNNISRYISSDIVKNPKNISVQGKYIYVSTASEVGLIHVLSDEKKEITLISSFNYSDYTNGEPTSISHSGNILFVFFEGGLLVLDSSDKTSLSYIQFDSSDEKLGVYKSFASGNKLYTVCNGTLNGSRIWDISDPKNIIISKQTLIYPAISNYEAVDIRVRDNTSYVLLNDIDNQKIIMESYDDLDVNDTNTVIELDFDDGQIATAFDMRGGIVAFATDSGNIYFYSINRSPLDYTESDYISTIDLIQSGRIESIVFNKNELIVLVSDNGSYSIKIVNTINLNSPNIVDSISLSETSISQMLLYNGTLYFSNTKDSFENGVFAIRPNYIELFHAKSKSVITDWLNIEGEGIGKGTLSVVNNMTLEEGGSFQGGIKTSKIKFINKVTAAQGLDRANINIGGRGLITRYEEGVDYVNTITESTTVEGASSIIIVGNFLVLSANWSEEVQIWNISNPKNPEYLTNSSIGAFKSATDGQFLFTSDNKTGHIRSFSIFEDGRIENVGSLYLDSNLTTSPPIDKFTVRNASGIVVEGKYAYILVASSSDLGLYNPSGIGLGSLFIVDISDPSDMKIVSRTYDSYLANGRDPSSANQNDFSGCFNLKKQGDRLYVVMSGSPTGLTVINIENVYNPEIMDVFFDGSDSGAYKNRLSISQNIAIKGKWAFVTHQESGVGYPVVPGGISVLDISETRWIEGIGSSISIVDHYTSTTEFSIGRPRGIGIYNDYILVTSDSPSSKLVVFKIIENGSLEFVTELEIQPSLGGLDQFFIHGKYLYIPFYNDPDTENGEIGIIDLGGLDIPNAKVSSLNLSSPLFVNGELSSQGVLEINGSVNIGYEGMGSTRGIFSSYGYSGQKYASFKSTSTGTASSSALNFGDGSSIYKINGNVGVYFDNKDALTEVFSSFTSGVYIVEFQGNIETTGTLPNHAELSIIRNGIILHTFSFDVKKNSMPLNFEYPVTVDDEDTNIQITLDSYLTSHRFSENSFLKFRRVS